MKQKSNERITSRQNPLLRHMKQLLRSGAYRKESGEYACDGFKLLVEALRWDVPIRAVVASDGAGVPELPPEVRLVRVPADVMESISLMQTPQGVVFSCAMPETAPLTLTGGCLVLDGMQDPGNVGTILRTADAMDTPVILCGDCADPYSPKVLRASMGAVFRTAPRRASCEALCAACREGGIELVAAALSEDAVDLRAMDLGRAAVIVGSEGQGVSQALLNASGRRLIIPMNPRCESLNAAAAAAIILWQMRR